jgi:putative peptidoglycan lipid II flippase
MQPAEVSARRRLALLASGIAGWVEVSVNRRILAASIRVGGATVVARGAFVLRELVVAYALGTSPQLGAFLLAALIPTFLAQAFSGALPAAFVPAFIHARESAGSAAAERLLGAAAIMLAMLLVVLTAPMIAIFPLYLRSAATMFSPSDRELAMHLLWILSPYILLRGFSALWGATLNAGRVFVLPGVTPALTPLVTAGALLAVRGAGVEMLAWTMTTGAVAEAAITAVAVRAMGTAVRPRWPGYLPEIRQLVWQFLPMIAGTAVLGATTFVDQSMAATVSSAAISVLYYANLLVLLPILVAGGTLGTATLPYASQMVADRQWPALEHTIMVYLRYIALVTIPLAAALMIFAPQVVALVFYRGAFTASDIGEVSEVVRYLAPQIPFCLGAVVAIQVLSALRRTDILLWSAVLSLGLKLVLNLLLIGPLGLAGIALSTSIIYAAALGFLLFFCFAHLRGRRHG